MQNKHKNAAKIIAAAIFFALNAATFGGCKKETYLDPTTLFENNEGLTFNGDSVSFSERKMMRTFKDGVAEEGFVVSYTVQGDNPDYTWVDSGGLYIELMGETVVVDEATNQTEALYHDIVIFQDPATYGQPTIASNACVWIVENGVATHGGTEEGAGFRTDMSFVLSRNPVQVKIVYYNEAYYFMLDKTCKVKIDANTTFNNAERFVNKDKFFKAGKRKLGFRTAMTPATYSKISYELGNDAALSALQSMKFEV